MLSEEKKQLWGLIKKAYEIDSMLPMEHPSRYHSFLGKMVVIPDDERSREDVLADIESFKRQIMPEEYDEWYQIMSKMLIALTPVHRKIFELRAKNYGWKKVATTLYKLKLTERTLHRATLDRLFNQGLSLILKDKSVCDILRQNSMRQNHKKVVYI